MASQFPRCQLIPDVGHRVRFLIDGQERLAWNFGRDYPRPCFYPLLGPSGQSLTRMDIRGRRTTIIISQSGLHITRC